jgi:predicted enzyme related to lactoylglutathione lyase
MLSVGPESIMEIPVRFISNGNFAIHTPDLAKAKAFYRD